ncbi:MAG: 4Fe-4S ferredoxin, partial [Thermodesulfobacteriota bacterium]
MRLEDHPTVKKFKEKSSSETAEKYSEILDSEMIKQIALECGADDAGIIQIDRPELDTQRQEIMSRFPWTRSVLSFVRKMNV